MKTKPPVNAFAVMLIISGIAAAIFVLWRIYVSHQFGGDELTIAVASALAIGLGVFSLSHPPE